MRAPLFRTLLLFYLSEFVLSDSCKKDNCLNAMNHSPSVASAFCTPYLTTALTATSDIPSFLLHWKASASRLSSACSCIVTTTAETKSPTLSTFSTASRPSVTTSSSSLSPTSSYPGTTTTASLPNISSHSGISTWSSSLHSGTTTSSTLSTTSSPSGTTKSSAVSNTSSHSQTSTSSTSSHSGTSISYSLFTTFSHSVTSTSSISSHSEISISSSPSPTSSSHSVASKSSPSSHSGTTTSSTLSTASSRSNTQFSCNATTTVTAPALTIISIVTSAFQCPSSQLISSTCPSIGRTSTITSVSTTTVPGGTSTITSVFITTATATSTVTAAVLPSCFPHINGGDFTSNSQNLGAFTVVESPGDSVFNEVIATSAQDIILINDGTPQFLLLNYELAPIPSAYTLQQYIDTVCAPYTSLTLSATIDTQFNNGIITFCISSTTCSPAQTVAATNGNFVQYSASFPITAGEAVTASVTLALDDFAPIYSAGIGNFQVSPV
ncbi:hypothetical protein G7Y89_g13589 [Cudoniella acicularis]|uniref:Uncharacterized protein n=1 Tax=Cudoniella acicularis TaxID=354080 RepID=A0A8H4VWA3_9HELO|nr:hypothetical protein G7Y89_g13589 [Cudoniella acicularis]